MSLRPFFPFYGSKWRDARRYPPPAGRVVEPFAGSAGYATWHEPGEVLLVDLDPIIVGVWEYLIRVSPAEVRRLPDLEPGQSVDDLRLPQEARWLIGFWLNRGSAQPKKTATAYSRRVDRQQLIWGAGARERIASQVERIRHWEVKLASYEAAPVVRATWFVDPPYRDKGRFYRFHAIDYPALGAWCRRLPGNMIVCEQEGAAWLPFTSLAVIKSCRGTSPEVCWTGGGR